MQYFLCVIEIGRAGLKMRYSALFRREQVQNNEKKCKVINELLCSGYFEGVWRCWERRSKKKDQLLS